MDNNEYKEIPDDKVEIVNDYEYNKKNNSSNKKKSNILAWIPFIFACLYVIFPIDLIPDIPGIGWADDGILLITTFINAILSNSDSKVIKVIRCGILAIGIILILIITLLATLIIKLITN